MYIAFSGVAATAACGGADAFFHFMRNFGKRQIRYGGRKSIRKRRILSLYYR